MDEALNGAECGLDESAIVSTQHRGTGEEWRKIESSIGLDVRGRGGGDWNVIKDHAKQRRRMAPFMVGDILQSGTTENKNRRKRVNK